MSPLTQPTELKDQLSKNRLARRVYRRLSLTAKQSYNSYVIAANSVDERRKRAEHAVKMMLGYAQSFA
jgi:uncharacterized protein YdeI (YjbR/CyaY-like superfamily)